VFDAISTSGTGLQTYHTWLDTIANNIANVNDETTTDGQVFRTQYVRLEALPAGSDGVGSGVEVAALQDSGENGVLVQAPTDPLADANGYVRRADVDLSEQMGDMIMAQRAFQANAASVDRAKDMYEAAINIGKNI
jgi:flagellar basal-body rod protein FlgC